MTPRAAGWAPRPRDEVQLERSFDHMWTDIEPVGRDAHTGGYRRFAWTRTDFELREWFANEAHDRDMEVVEDRAGNQWAWFGDPDVRPGVVVGSHLDSVPDGGAYDGPLGLISAFAAFDVLRVRGVVQRMERPLGIVNFGDEEGARFGVACAGSRLITGALDPDRARALTDADGVTLADAMRDATGDWRSVARVGADPQALRRIAMFVELHVEQGRGLADLGRAVGVASGIRPHGRWRLDLPGTANHAGTTLMADRDDAMLSLAHLIGAVHDAAVAHDGVATCGKVAVTPNGVNAIASHVAAWLDARASSEQQVRDIVADVQRATQSRGGTLTEESWTGLTTFDGALSARIVAALDNAPVLDTGAGHDAGILAAAGIPATMLFVRNPTGVSHSPAEFAERADCLAGVAALATVIETLGT